VALLARGGAGVDEARFFVRVAVLAGHVLLSHVGLVPRARAVLGPRRWHELGRHAGRRASLLFFSHEGEHGRDTEEDDEGEQS
jgi:hypothetical protein